MTKYLIDQNEDIENLVQFSLDGFDYNWKPLDKINPKKPTDCAANALCFLRSINRNSAQVLANHVGSGVGMTMDMNALPTKEQQLNKARYYNIDPDFLLSIKSIKQILQEYLNNIKDKKKSKVRLTSKLSIEKIFIFFKKFLKEQSMTIINLGRSNGNMSHTVIICRGEGDKIFIFDPQNYDFFDNEHTIQQYIRNHSYDYFRVYMETDVLKRKLIDVFDYSIKARREHERVPKKARTKKNYVTGRIRYKEDQYPTIIPDVMTRDQLEASGLGFGEGTRPGYSKLLPDGRELVGLAPFVNNDKFKLLFKKEKMSDYDRHSNANFGVGEYSNIPEKPNFHHRSMWGPQHEDKPFHVHDTKSPLFSMGKIPSKSRKRRRKSKGGKNKTKYNTKTIKKKCGNK